MEDTSARIGHNIRSIRKNKGFTQQYIADHVGVTKQTISKIENGATANQSTLERIAKALFVDIQQLYEKRPIQKSPNDIVDFITIDEKEATLHEQLYPLYKNLNDIVAKRYAETIRKKCSLDAEQIEQILIKAGYHAESYSPKELCEICEKLNNEFILKVYAILNDTTEDN